MARGEIIIRRALLGVSDKAGLLEFAQVLAGAGCEILSTGGTRAALERAGLSIRPVENFTGSPEMLDGRVKTLHPKIYGGILARRDLPSHRREMEAHGIEPIDLVVVNFYPFEQTVEREGGSLGEAIENIDIGGPALVRAAAKNYAYVAVVVDPGDYATLCEELRASRGALSLETRWRLARKAFARVTAYDSAISNYLGTHAEGESSALGETFSLSLPRAQTLRYGENPHQQGALYGDFPKIAEQLHGRELSFNNVIDITSAINLILEFQDYRDAVVAILKHNTPCGVGVAPTLKAAWDKAFATDPDSPFGGIIISNRPWDIEFARAVDELFTEVLIGRDYEAGVIDFLRQKKNRRLIRFHPKTIRPDLDVRRVLGGLLVQTPDLAREDPRMARVVTRRAPTDAELRALDFGIRVCKHVKSNAIVFAAEDRTLAVGGGATSRIDPVYAAREKAARLGVGLAGSVLVSEALFPFPDGPALAAEAGATAIAQPGGAVRDREVIEAADSHGIAMVFTGVRHFRH